MIGSPVSASSLAMLRGSMRGSRSRPPPAATSERLTSGMPSFAPSAATIRSQASAISSPPATAKPSIAAISGLSEPRSVIPRKAAPLDPRHLAGGKRLEVHAGAEETAGAGDDPDRRATRRRRARRAPARCRRRPRALTALRCSGRLRVITSTRSRRSVRTVGLSVVRADRGHAANSRSSGSRSPRRTARSTSTQAIPRDSASTRACGLIDCAASTPRQLANCGSVRSRSR